MRRALILGAAAVCISGAAAAKVVRYTLPEQATVTLPKGAGSKLVEAQCAACHSLDYITTQPRGKGKPFWDATVTKMVKVYGAPVEAKDADAIAAYLGRTY